MSKSLIVRIILKNKVEINEILKFRNSKRLKNLGFFMT